MSNINFVDTLTLKTPLYFLPVIISVIAKLSKMTWYAFFINFLLRTIRTTKKRLPVKEKMATAAKNNLWLKSRLYTMCITSCKKICILNINIIGDPRHFASRKNINRIILEVDRRWEWPVQKTSHKEFLSSGTLFRKYTSYDGWQQPVRSWE